MRRSTDTDVLPIQADADVLPHEADTNVVPCGIDIDIFPEEADEILYKFETRWNLRILPSENIHTFLLFFNPNKNKIYYRRQDFNKQYQKHFINIRWNSLVTVENKKNDDRFNWMHMLNSLDNPPEPQNLIKTDRRIGFKYGKCFFLVNKYFTLGERRVENGQVHLYQLTNSILYLYHYRGIENNSYRERSLNAFKIPSHFHRIVLQPEGFYIIPEGTIYVLVSPGKCLFSLQLWNRDVPHYYVNPIAVHIIEELTPNRNMAYDIRPVTPDIAYEMPSTPTPLSTASSVQEMNTVAAFSSASYVHNTNRPAAEEQMVCTISRNIEETPPLSPVRSFQEMPSSLPGTSAGSVQKRIFITSQPPAEENTVCTISRKKEETPPRSPVRSFQEMPNSLPGTPAGSVQKRIFITSRPPAEENTVCTISRKEEETPSRSPVRSFQEMQPLPKRCRRMISLLPSPAISVQDIQEEITRTMNSLPSPASSVQDIQEEITPTMNSLPSPASSVQYLKEEIPHTINSSPSPASSVQYIKEEITLVSPLQDIQEPESISTTEFSSVRAPITFATHFQNIKCKILGPPKSDYLVNTAELWKRMNPMPAALKDYSPPLDLSTRQRDSSQCAD